MQMLSCKSLSLRAVQFLLSKKSSSYVATTMSTWPSDPKCESMLSNDKFKYPTNDKNSDPGLI